MRTMVCVSIFNQLKAALLQKKKKNFAGHASLLTCPTTDYNPYSANLAGHASWLTCPITEFSKAVVFTIAVKVLGMLQHTNPLSLN